MRKFKRLISVLMSAVFAFSFCLVWDKGDVKAATAADTVLTEFLNSGYDKTSDATIEIYDGSNEYNYFQMNGRNYYQGITFWKWGYETYISFNVENYNKISFDLGHVDNTNECSFTLSIYKDGKWYRDIEQSAWGLCERYEIDLTGTSTLKFMFNGVWGGKGIGDICLDGYTPSMTHDSPIFENGNDFVKSIYNFRHNEMYDDDKTVISYDNSDNYCMLINGKKYYNGLAFGYYNYQAFAQLNVENVNSITFLAGHIDDTTLTDKNLTIYLDDKYYYTLNLKANDIARAYYINTSKASTIRFVLDGGNGNYGLANFVLNEDYDSITDGSYSDKSKIRDIDLLIRKGDIDGNGTINLYDIIEVARYIMGMRTFNTEEMQLADYNEDSKVDLYDAVEMARLIMK